MNTILMVDDENPFLLSLKDGLTAQNDQLNILLANDGRQALDIIRENDIDLLVTDLKLPVMDGFQLLAQVSKSNPYLPVIVMTAFGTPEIEEKLSGINALHYLEKPLDFDVLAHTIETALTTESNSYIRGITLATFLQLVQMEKKSCSLTIHAGGKSGQLFIRQGELIDATSGSLVGKEAALEIIAWENAEIEMDATCRSDSQTITSPLGFILMEAHRLKDEDNHNRARTAIDLPSAEGSPAGGLSADAASLAARLKNTPAVKEFAIFNAGNALEHIFPEHGTLDRLDPAYYLSASQSVGSFMETSSLKYLLFTTGRKQQYMIFSSGERRVIVALRSNSRADDLYRELKPSIDASTSAYYRRDPHATTH